MIFFRCVFNILEDVVSPRTCSRLDALLESHADEESEEGFEEEFHEEMESDILTFRQLVMNT
jgi:hypothetical protein